MGRVYMQKLDGMFYRCRACHTHLAKFDDLMSKFHWPSDVSLPTWEGLPVQECVSSFLCALFV
ncbi:hypothetical protein KP509_35G046500 [Ceratopteris richardii]|uniref:Yippee domain-containing protein n=1 Tax=Ceratopteris richardii TaxID=49495 RepID=A0A8T2QGJ1_CERRI|nr:hypothetical protein KP509_35G046500 [Ceratopteris richardii]KAH7282757.1 hypothetical protein KP509_35G046500 [Ceratopteris richardii]KAH7282758.1 hypothetical protein KP509_35G046500 [Ceratopteris richardii]KAH7282759.1 hypothetical protein KP509_35G046500 [Ceratopteris richardii]